MRCGALVTLGLLAACTEASPAPPLLLDARADGASGDGRPLCAPGAFLACTSGTQALRCDGAGTGTVAVDCSPYTCDATAGRCSQCDPAAAGTCQGSELVSCSAEGLLVKTACPGGCVAGACAGCVKKSYYLDSDADGYGRAAQKQEACVQPAGYVPNSLDCDDLDPAAHPGQLAFFNVSTKGTRTFDYNCDGVEQPEAAGLVSCLNVGMSCQGDGWVGTIPACGQAGVWGKCNKQGSGQPGCGTTTSSKIQSCH